MFVFLCVYLELQAFNPFGVENLQDGTEQRMRRASCAGTDPRRAPRPRHAPLPRGESPPWTPAHSPSHPLFPRVAQPGPEERCEPRSSARLHSIFPMMKGESRFPQGGGKAKSTQCSFIVVFVNTFISTMGSSELVGHSRDCKRLGNIRSMNDPKQKNKSMSNKLHENSDAEKNSKT